MFIKKLMFFSVVLSCFIFLFSPFFIFANDSSPQMETGESSLPEITASDFNINKVGILPTSPWYFLKEWRRSIQKLFTFGEKNKANLELKFSDEKAAEILKIKDSLKSNEQAIIKSLANYASTIDRLKEKAKNISFSEFENRYARHTSLLGQIREKHLDSQKYQEIANITRQAENTLQETLSTAADNNPKIKERAENRINDAALAIKELDLAIKNFNENISSGNFSYNLPISCVFVCQGQPDFNQCFKDCQGGNYETLAAKQWLSSNFKVSANRLNLLANEHLVLAQKAFEEKKYGQAFGLATSSKKQAENGLRMLNIVKENIKSRQEFPSVQKNKMNETPDFSNKKEIKNNNPTSKTQACPSETVPACEKPAFPQCVNGLWRCIGPASPGAISPEPQSADASLYSR